MIKLRKKEGKTEGRKGGRTEGRRGGKGWKVGREYEGGRKEGRMEEGKERGK